MMLKNIFHIILLFATIQCQLGSVDKRIVESHEEAPEFQFLRSIRFPVDALIDCYNNEIAKRNYLQERQETKDYQLKFGRVISEEEVDERMDGKWRRLFGRDCLIRNQFWLEGMMPRKLGEPKANTGFELTIKKSDDRDCYGRTKKFNFEKGNPKEIVSTKPYFPEMETGDSCNNFKTGILLQFADGKLSQIGCYYKHDPCDQTIYLNSQGEVTKVTKEKIRCKEGCGHLVPYRIPGSYFIADNKVRVRKEPSIQSEIITELSKETPIEVTADAEVYEEIFPHYGTWGKVKLDDGREGYVYGALLRAPGEPDVVAIREKAEAWKKKNGWKGK